MREQDACVLCGKESMKGKSVCQECHKKLVDGMARVGDAAFKMVPPEIVEKCVADVRENMDEDTKKKIRDAYERLGPGWVCEIGGGHFFWGMCMRNRFRDVILPRHLGAVDWDNVYCPIIEYALGLRKIK